MLWACLLLPSLSLDVFARAASPADAVQPFAVTTGGRTPRIVDANAPARDAGVRAGQLVSASLALAPDLLLRERDPHAEAAALEAVATWATQFTPTVVLAPPGAALAEIGGSLRLFGGLSPLTARLSRGVRDLGYTAQLALAPTPAAALLFARAENGAKPGAPHGARRPALPGSASGRRPAAPAPRWRPCHSPSPTSIPASSPRSPPPASRPSGRRARCRARRWRGASARTSSPSSTAHAAASPIHERPSCRRRAIREGSSCPRRWPAPRRSRSR